MKLYARQYCGSFRCIGGACPRNCCIGWEIDIDEDAIKKYDALGGEIGEKISESIDRSGECPHFKLSCGERCMNLREDNLCSVIAECGEEMIPEICREHPRFYNVYPDRCEVGVGLACPAAAELILSAGDHGVYEIGEIDIDGGEDEPILHACRAFLDAVIEFGRAASVRGIVAFANFHSRVTVADWVFENLRCPADKAAIKKDYFLSRWVKRLDFAPREVEIEAVVRLLCGLEVLDVGYDARIKDAIYDGASRAEEIRDYITDNRECFFALLHYFLYRHIMTGAEAGSIYAAVQLATVSAYTVLSLAFFSGNTVAQEAVDYSRNIEYSDSNIYDFIDEVEANPDFGIGFILDILRNDAADC